MPPRRPARAPQESNTVKFFKLVFLLGCAMLFKIMLSMCFRSWGLVPTRSAVDDLADPSFQRAAAHVTDIKVGTAEDAGSQDQPVEEQEGDSENVGDYETPAQFVARSIKDNRVMIFSKSYCPYSMRGKAVMRKHLGEAGVAVVELDQRQDMQELQDELLRITGGRTVPRIFVDQQFIGGADDVTALDSSGQLEHMLREKGLIGDAAADGGAAAAA